jgi:dTDP-4-dehydrorhamnose reductase
VPNKKLWLILGGTGQLGRSLQSQLLKKSIDFIAPNSNNLDLKDFINARKFILEYQPNVVVNCAAWTNVSEAEGNSEEVNIVNGYSVRQLLMACGEISATYAHVSTDYVFSGTKNSPYLVNDKTDPLNAYGVSKALGEKFTIDSGLEKFYIFRTAWLYSEFGNNFVKTIISKYISGQEEIKVVNDQFGNPTYAPDLALQIIEAINRNVSAGIYHSVNSGTASWYDLAVKTIENLGYDTKKIQGVTSGEYRSDILRPQNTSLDVSEWSKVGMQQMQPWDAALKSAIPEIIKYL